MTFFDITRTDELTREQRVEQPAEIDAEIVLDELRVELRVVGDLDRTRRGQQTSQRRERIALTSVAVRKMVEVNDVNAVGSSELDQPQARGIRIEFSRLSVQTNNRLTGEDFDGFAEFIRCPYQFVIRHLVQAMSRFNIKIC